jgi:hypothetical protein
MKRKWKSFLVELEDQNWFPNWMRQYQVDFLGGVSRITRLYGPCAELLNSFKPKKIVDLASGNGQSAKILLNQRSGVIVEYTDKFPPESELEVSKLDLLKDELPQADLYTLLNGLHHFDENQIRALITRVPPNGSFLFIEPIGPRLGSFIKVSLSTLILPFFLVPFLKPFRWDRLFITYLLPIGPLICFYDGIISVIKSYALKDLQNIALEISKESRPVQVGNLRSLFTTFNYLSS